MPLTEADRLFENTQNDLVALRRAMDDASKPVAGRVAASGPKAADAKKSMQELVNKIRGILSAMEGLTTINNLIKDLAIIERQEETIGDVVKRVLKRRIEEVLQGKD